MDHHSYRARCLFTLAPALLFACTAALCPGIACAAEGSYDLADDAGAQSGLMLDDVTQADSDDAGGQSDAADAAIDDAYSPASLMLASLDSRIAALSEDTRVTSGYCGDSVDGADGKNIYWSFADGTLTLTGTGGMGFWNDASFWGQDVFPGWRAAGLNGQITQIVIGEGITEIGSAAFAYIPNLESVTLPSSIKTVQQSAFKGCAKLSSVVLNDGLESIDTQAFNDTSITSLHIPNSVTALSSSMFGTANYSSGRTSGLDVSQLVFDDDNQNFKFADGVLYRCDAGQPVEIVHCSLLSDTPTGTFEVPSFVTAIGSQAFLGMHITGVILNDGLESIGSNAFSDTDITSVHIPASVNQIAWGAFGGCPKLTTVTGCAGLTVVDGFAYDEALSTVVLDEGPTSIGERAFAKSAVASIVLPRSVTTIGDDAFNSSGSLASVQMPGVQTIGRAAFANCSSLADVSLPEGLVTIGNGAFYGTALASMTIPESVTSIGKEAFPESTQLILPSSLSKMSDGSYRCVVSLSYDVTYDQAGARSMFDMVNDFRTGSDAWYYDSDGSVRQVTDLQALTYDYRLERHAMQRAAEAAVLMSHMRPDGSFGYAELGEYSSWGENLAWGYGSASSAFEGWQETNESYSGQGHRRNMLGSGFNAIGIGHAKYNGLNVWVQVFGYSDTPDVQATEAVNGTREATIVVPTDELDQYAVTANPSSITLATAGDSADLPTLAAQNVRFSVNGNTARIDAARITNGWTSSDSSIASIADGKVVAGDQDGMTYIRAYASPAGYATVPVFVGGPSADLVNELVAALPDSADLTYGDKAAFVAARNAYDLLDDGQKALVSDYSRLTDGEKAIAALEEPVTIATTDLPDAAEGVPYTYRFGSTGPKPVTWSTYGLPTGLTLDASTGAISGTPSEQGNWIFSTTVTGPAGQTDNAWFMISVGAYSRVERLYGALSDDTAAAIAQRAFPDGARTVVIARDDQYYDALAGAGLAGALDAPVLLTSSDSLSDSCRGAIAALGATKAFILGGHRAVSPQVETDLVDMGIDTERIDGGMEGGVYETSLAINQRLASMDNSDATHAIVVNPTSFADAVSISGWAYRNHVPVMLQTWGDSASERGYDTPAQALLAGRQLIVCGGELAVSDESVRGIDPGYTRLGGATIYDTSLEIAEWELAHGMNVSDVTIASAIPDYNGVDALAASALAGRQGGVVLLAQSNPAYDWYGTDMALGFVSDHASEIERVHVLGGRVASTPKLYDAIKGALGE